MTGVQTCALPICIGTPSPGSKLDVYAGSLTLRSPPGLPNSLIFDRDAPQSHWGLIEFGASSGTSIYGDGTSGTLALGAGGTTRLQINSSGNVGIGTQSPDTRLDMAGGTISMGPLDGAGEIRFRTGTANNASGGVGLTALDHSGAYADGMAIYGHDGISLWTAQTERMRITISGNVGIGTTTPGAALDVSGAIKAQHIGLTAYNGGYLSLADSVNDVGNSWNLSQTAFNAGNFGIVRYDPAADASKSFIITPAGNVGIGTTSPSAKLEVAGSLKVSGAGNSITTPVLSITGGSDVAEPFPLASQEIPKGSVVVIDDEHPGQLKLSTEPYDQQIGRAHV